MYVWCSCLPSGCWFCYVFVWIKTMKQSKKCCWVSYPLVLQGPAGACLLHILDEVRKYQHVHQFIGHQFIAGHTHHLLFTPLLCMPIACNEGTMQVCELIGDPRNKMSDSVVIRPLATHVPLNPQQSHSPEVVSAEAPSLVFLSFPKSISLSDSQRTLTPGVESRFQEWIDRCHIHRKNYSETDD